MNSSKFQRALGYLEGIAMAMKEPAKSLLMQTAQDIEAAVNPAAWIGGGKPAVDGPEEDALIKRLMQHHLMHERGETQDYSKVCTDCKKAAVLIVRLRSKLEQMSFELYERG